MEQLKIVVVGATGNLGQRIIKSLIERKAKVAAIFRNGSNQEKIDRLKKLGVESTELNFSNHKELVKMCTGARCVVSALAGLREVIIETQTQLLNAAVEAKVPRFIPSDYSADFTKLAPGSNRNFDLRREFHLLLDIAPIKATSIFNGAFTGMLTGQAPFILFKFKRVLYWQNPDQLMDFTTIDDTAVFTALAALDDSTPRILRISGNQVSARDLVKIASEVLGAKYHLFRAGNLKMLEWLIKFTRTFTPDKGELYPPWQGMQYMHNMYSGLTTMENLDNGRYSSLRWTKVRDVLEEFEKIR